MNQQEVTCTVTDKESVRVEDSNQYRVYTEDCGTLVVSDTIVGARFNSADIYGQIEPGETYPFKTGGYRIPVASQFPNILEVIK